MGWQEQLDLAVAQREQEMVRLRRHLHAHPELSGQERETSLMLYQKLGDEGFAVRLGLEGRGVVADLSPVVGGPPRRTIALRADIDALRIHDAKQVSYRSQHPGVMHACGHDAHTSLVYGAVSALKQLHQKSALPSDIHVRAVFQPAEETCQGAKEMISVGVLDGVDSILAVHMDPMRRLGHVGLRVGVLTANCDEMTIVVVGRGGHAARPHEASDPIAAAAQLINAMYQFIPRATDSQDAVVVTIGHVKAGDNANVIPEQVLLRGTVRTLDQNVRRQTFDHIRRLASGIGQTTDTKIGVEFGVAAGSVCNDAGLIHLLRQACSDVVGNAGLEEIPRPSMGSEDFSYYLEHVPGAMLRLGCSSDTLGGCPLHSSSFDIDEQALLVGARILAHTVVLWSLERCATDAVDGIRQME